MNWALWIGVAFGAASLWFLYYGTHLAGQKGNQDTAQTVRTEVNRVLERIDAVQKTVSNQSSSGASSSPTSQPSSTALRRDAEQELADIDRGFSQWASNFIKSRDLKKLELDRQRLEARTTEMEISQTYRPMFQYAVDVLRGVIKAYNEKAGTTFTAELVDLPTNLYLNDSTFFEVGIVRFSPETRWRAYAATNKPAAKDHPPFFQIDIIQNPGASSGDAIRIQTDYLTGRFTVVAFGGGLATTAKISGSGEVTSFQEPIRKALEQLVEAQIASLPVK